MWLRALALRRTATYSTPTSAAKHSPVGYFTSPRFASSNPALPFRSPLYKTAASFDSQKQSASSICSVALVLGIAVGGALLYPLVVHASQEDITTKTSSTAFDRSNYTDSYLVMAPNTPAGRPGTLTPDQEVKLRELWAMTMKVFGVYEPGSATETNGSAETPVAAAAPETPEKDGKKDKKDRKDKKSRLNVFRRNKGDKDKGTDTESIATTGTSTSANSDIGALSIADEDDKHGQTKEFKLAIANMSPEDLRTAFWSMVKHDHPDALLLRFLRARKWDVEKALVMMISTMHWRLEEMHVDDDVMKNGEEAALRDSKSSDPKVKKEAEDFLAQLRMGKSFLHGLDADGRPLCVVRARLHRAGEQTEASLERFTVYLIETARMLLRPPIDTATIVFDMTDFSMANMDYTPVKFMIKCFEANYPESLGTVLVYKAPWIFNAIWNIIRGWLDPVVAGKVHFAKTVDELEKFVPRSQIITDLGGDEQWTYEYVEPKEGENAAFKDEARRRELEDERGGMVAKYESTVLAWVTQEDKTKSLEERRKERDMMAEELCANYWKLDPYVRARSLWDRTGVIGEGGKLTFYPGSTAVAAEKEKENAPAPPPPPPAAAAAAAAKPETSADDLD